MNPDKMNPSIEEMVKLPIGSILPFGSIEETPEGWKNLNGDLLRKEDYPEVDRVLRYAKPGALRIWNQMGGSVTEEGILLPNLSDSEAYRAVFGQRADAPLVLAIKVKRDINSDGDTSSIHGDDSPQGQPGE